MYWLFTCLYNKLIDKRYALYIKPFSNECGWKHRNTHKHDGKTHFKGSLINWRILKVHKDSIRFVQFIGRLRLISRKLHGQQKCKAENTHPIFMFIEVEQCMKMKMRLTHCEKWLIQLPFYKYLFNCDINFCYQHGTWKPICSILHCFILCL
jgi:hypothetical protein